MTCPITILSKTGITSIVGFAIIAIIFAQDVNENDNDTNSVKGICFAIFSALSYGSYFVLIRLAAKINGSGSEGDGKVDLNACNVISGLVVVVIAACLGGGSDVDKIRGGDLLFLCIQGILILPISFTLLIIGPQYILAPEVCLYSFLETILGPLWVWLGGFERPPVYTFYGGIILLVVLGGNSMISIREAAKLRPNEEEDNEIGGDNSVVVSRNGGFNPASTSTPKKLFQFQKIIPDEFESNYNRRNVITSADDGAGW